MKFKNFFGFHMEILCFTKIFLWKSKLHIALQQKSSFLHILSIQNKYFCSEPMKSISASHIVMKNLHVFICQFWNFNKLLDVFLEAQMLPFDVKQAFVFLIPKNAVHVTNPTRDHFFIKKWFCDTLSLRIFDFIVFQQKFRLQGSLYWRVGGQSFSGQRSRVRAQCLEKILIVIGMLRTPISQNHLLSCDQPSRGWDFLSSEEAALMSDLKVQQSQNISDFIGNTIETAKIRCLHAQPWSPQAVHVSLEGCLQPPQMARKLGIARAPEFHEKATPCL